MNILTIFIALQIITLLLISLHDWVHLPPLTNIRELEKHHTVRERCITSLINALIVLVPLVLTMWWQPSFPGWARITIISCYGLLTIGTIGAWWIPYIFGSSSRHKAGFVEYQNTHHFLPARGDNVIPNTFHVILHLCIWSCLALALYLL